MRCTPARLKLMLVSLLTLLALLTCGFLLWQSLRERDASLDAANRQVLANARSLAEHTYQSLAEVDRIIAGVAAAIGQKGGIQSWQE